MKISYKVIDLLFLNGLKKEFEGITALMEEKTRRTKLEAFQEKLAGLKFLDPACGSRNFLTEIYISLRQLENKVLVALYYNQILIDMDNPIRFLLVSFTALKSMILP